MRILTILSGLLLLVSCSENKLDKVDFLTGSWQIEGKEHYEVWERTKKNELSGYSYKVVDNQKTILETLSIIVNGNDIIYEAMVPDQNEGKTVQFVLNANMDTYLSFENPEHDFPKKIQYHKKSDREIMVRVFGEEGKGFSITLIKQKVE